MLRSDRVHRRYCQVLEAIPADQLVLTIITIGLLGSELKFKGTRQYLHNRLVWRKHINYDLARSVEIEVTDSGCNLDYFSRGDAALGLQVQGSLPLSHHRSFDLPWHDHMLDKRLIVGDIPPTENSCQPQDL
jgi:hypothetical protein